MNKFVSIAIAALIFSIVLGISVIIDFAIDRTVNNLLIGYSIVLFLVGITYLLMRKRK
ncbi:MULTISPECIES: hypothetical protein [unclassified Rummeliibacillus]|uniref:hypothetical protein n=1 Tax=unclassified Rummeliibacillus TaxID=2622809 RepID=UPI001314C89F|nr:MULTISPECIES: hypothetical protein [unclassified Rummeliibacillus]